MRAPSLGIELRPESVRDASEIEHRHGVGGLILTGGALVAPIKYDELDFVEG